eukprot:1355111-Amorphochlora_amoeboformis.AAC.1
MQYILHSRMENVVKYCAGSPKVISKVFFDIEIGGEGAGSLPWNSTQWSCLRLLGTSALLASERRAWFTILRGDISSVVRTSIIDLLRLLGKKGMYKPYI